jgi:hypothetical protein
MDGFRVQITVDGPGSVINYEMHVIQQALEAAGYVVEVINEHPLLENATHPAGTNAADFIENRSKQLAKRPEKVKLIAHHRPWGG